MVMDPDHSPPPELTAAIDQLLREQTDQTNVIEALWLLYAARVNIPPRTTQWIESRRCFFAGALTLFECMQRIMTEDREPTEADMARMARIAQELDRYGAELKARLA